MAETEAAGAVDGAQASTSVQLFSKDAVVEHGCEQLTTHSCSCEISSVVENLSDDERRNFFDINETVEWIKSHGYSRVALQFPDQLLRHSSDVAQWLENESGAKTFILADTSYRSCCVDDVAAEHANADCIIHYGDACLSEYSGRYPLRYVFGRLHVDLEHLKEEISKNLRDFSKDCLLLCDAMYSNYAEDLVKCVSSVLPTALYASLLTSSSDSVASLGRYIPAGFSDLPEVTVVFVGENDSPLLSLWLMTHINCTQVFSYSPSTCSTSFSSSSILRQLRRRLFLIEKVRDANTIGVVVCSLGVSGYREAVQRMRMLCKVADKKIYVLSVGKVNVPKLSNFASDVDVFVVLSCPFGVLLDTSDYYRPIVSLFEAEIALNPSKEWSAAHGWTAESRDILNDAIGEATEELPDVSLITGRIRGGHRGDGEGNVQNQISLYNAGAFAGDRTWKGLVDTCSGEESTEVQEGRKGIASHYVSEAN